MAPDISLLQLHLL